MTMPDSPQSKPFRITIHHHVDDATSILVRPQAPDGSDAVAIRRLVGSDARRTIPGDAKGALSLIDHFHASSSYLPAFSLVATLGGRPVGYLLAVQVPVGSWTMLSLVGMAIGLEGGSDAPAAPAGAPPLGSPTSATRASVAEHLLDSTVRAARAAIYSGLFIVGSAASYPSLDLQPAATFAIAPPVGIPADALLVCETLPGSILATKATLRLDADFAIALTKAPPLR